MVSNGCAYVTDQKGVAQTDYVFNSYMANNVWPTVASQIMDSFKGPAAKFIILKAPQNILNAITVTCGTSTQATQVGLLGAIGWTSLLDVNALLGSEEILKKIQEGERWVFMRFILVYILG